jgi:hypothetical protein
MKDYLYFRTKEEFNDVDLAYRELFDKWLECWNYREIHDKLYSLYVRLQILCLLLRNCLKYKMIENIPLKTKDGEKSLGHFCNYVIHRSSGVYEDNRQSKDFSKDGLEVYLKIDTDIKEQISFVITDIITKIREEVKKFPDPVTSK